MEISLSILNMDYNHIEEELNKYREEIKYLHLDIMDGHFVPNISFGPAVVKSIHKENDFIYDTHLMISDPMKYIKEFVEAGSDYITFHLEAVENVIEVIDYIHSFGVKAGLSVKPNTKVEELLPYLSKLDLVLVMSVEPGFGGQRFMDGSIDKVRLLKEWKEERNYSYLISIDGGINDLTLNKVEPYLDLVVVGSYITASKNPLENIKLLKHNL
ncbi:MAG: ribulose-phosphate 3-epimerase [Anaeroplasmataceae bacterium]|nr:ribulose-phosphate 3-epimerase [Anaeroplasmataceae bacterium]MDE6414843.1 ribulose-phosphate 3-epimerase [Anaeroplasmataceae bacterium]